MPEAVPLTGKYAGTSYAPMVAKGRVYFLSDRAQRGTAQLYSISPDGGEATALTDWEHGVAGYLPLRDGRIALLAINAETEDQKARKERRDDADERSWVVRASTMAEWKWSLNMRPLHARAVNAR